jgi:hypothetical protein
MLAGSSGAMKGRRFEQGAPEPRLGGGILLGKPSETGSVP